MTVPQVGQTGGDSFESLPFNILIIKDILDKAYGEDNVDIVKIFNADCGYKEKELPFEGLLKSSGITPYYYRIIILIPEILVTNSYGETHLMRDLFVGFVVNKEGILVGNTFYLNRGTLSEDEYISQYIFSHANRGTIYSRVVSLILNTTTNSTENSTYDDVYNCGEQDRWAHCCLGNGVINQTLTVLSSTFDPIMWQLFVCQLNSYVAYEDNVGGPYKCISSIHSGGNRINLNGASYFSNMPNYPNYDILQWMISNIKFSLNVTNGFIEPIISTKFEVIEDYIYNYMRKDGTTSSYWFAYKSNTNQYFNSIPSDRTSTTSCDLALPFSFKGAIPYIKISSFKEDEGVQFKRTVSPPVTCYFIRAYFTFITLKLSKITLYNL